MLDQLLDGSGTVHIKTYCQEIGRNNIYNCSPLDVFTLLHKLLAEIVPKWIYENKALSMRHVNKPFISFFLPVISSMK